MLAAAFLRNGVHGDVLASPLAPCSSLAIANLCGKCLVTAFHIIAATKAEGSRRARSTDAQVSAWANGTQAAKNATPTNDPTRRVAVTSSPPTA